MFSFGFKIDNESDESPVVQPTEPKETGDNVIWLEAEEVTFTDDELQEKMQAMSAMEGYMMLAGDSVEVCYLIPDESTLPELNSRSDLIPAKYEGGLKIWECTQDLADYLCESPDNENEDTEYVMENTLCGQFKDKRVLDLGCGAGILGIIALKAGAREVVFQDYNKEVLADATLLNILLNYEDDSTQECLKRCRFYSGDWLSFSRLAGEHSEKFDYILTAETIYNCDNYAKLLTVFFKCLAQNGLVYLAAKTCYFGVGGSLRDFEEHLGKTDGLRSARVWQTASGVKREILKIERDDGGNQLLNIQIKGDGR